MESFAREGFEEVELLCPQCSSHTGIRCKTCGKTFDLTYYDDEEAYWTHRHMGISIYEGNTDAKEYRVVDE